MSFMVFLVLGIGGGYLNVSRMASGLSILKYLVVNPAGMLDLGGTVLARGDGI